MQILLTYFFMGLDFYSMNYNVKFLIGQAYILGFTFVNVFWLFFTCSLIKRENFLYNRNKLILLIIPMICLILALSNPWTGYFYSKVFVSSFYSQLNYIPNWGFYLTDLYNFIIEIISLVIIIKGLRDDFKFFSLTYKWMLVFTSLTLLLFPILYTNTYSMVFYPLSIVLVLIGFIIIYRLTHNFEYYNQRINQKIVDNVDVGVTYFSMENTLIAANPASNLININNADKNQSVEKIFKNQAELIDFYYSKERNKDFYYNNHWINIKKEPLYYKEELLGKTLIISNIDREKNQLAQKDLLIKEVHHRVKSNLQLILSLLNLDLRFNTEDPIVIIENTRSRLKYMSILHEKIYKSNDLNEVQIKEYVPEIVDSILSIYNSPIHMVADLEDYNLTVDDAIPLGLIITEIVINTIKNGFKGISSGDLFIKFQIVDNFGIMDFYDNGNGLPDGFSLENPNNLSILIITSLCKDLDGKFELINSENSHFKLIFPL